MLIPRRNDDGQLTLLIVGMTAIAAVLIAAAVDVSAVFLARRSLSSAADAAAIDAAQAVDRSAIYSGQVGCGTLLPLDPAQAAASVQRDLDDDGPNLRGTFARIDSPAVDVRAGTVTVRLGGDVHVPFGRLVSRLLPGTGSGLVHVAVTSSAQSPVSTPAGC